MVGCTRGMARRCSRPNLRNDRYRGVKYDETGQNVLASTYIIQLKGKDYVLVWPEQAAAAKLDWPMKGWR